MNVLVFDGETRAALAVTRSLGRAGVRVTVAASTSRALATASRHCAAVLKLPDAMSDPDGAREALHQRVAQVGSELWLPVTDASLALVCEMRAELGDVVFPYPPNEVLELAWDKAALLARAYDLGVACPQTHAPTSIDEVRRLAGRVSYPVVIKPRRSRARAAGGGFVEGQVSYAGSAAELVDRWGVADRSVARPLVQERIDGYGVGIFLLSDHGRVLARFAHRRLREKPPSGGVSVLRESIPMPVAAFEGAVRLVEELRWHGVLMVEFRVEGATGVPYLMEINPRFWGSLQLAVDAGVDFPALLYRLASGEPQAPVMHYRVGVRSRWLLGDLDHLLIRWRRREGSPDLPARPASRLATLMAFLNPCAGRPEILRLDDPAPAWREFRAYLQHGGDGGR